MKIGAKKLELNKWQFRFILEKCPPWMFGFAPHIIIHFAKFHTRPNEGECFTKDHYKGFIIDWTVPLYRLTLMVRTVRIAKLNFIYWIDVFYKK